MPRSFEQQIKVYNERFERSTKTFMETLADI